MRTVHLQLKRELTGSLFEEKAIYGNLTVTIFNDSKFERRMYIRTLENLDYIFPAGVYNCEVELSQKFNRLLVELKGIPNRSEIKIHNGSKVEHSKGCILIHLADLNELMKLVRVGEKITITVIN